MFVPRTFNTMRLLALVAVISLIAVVTAFDFDDAQADRPEATSTAARMAESEANSPTLDELVLDPIGEFGAPVEAFSRNDDDRTFVVELFGAIMVTNGTTTETVLDISALTVIEGERGLLGAAFHPNEPLLYVHYNDLDGDSIIAEYQVDPDSAIADPASARQVLSVDQPYDNHNGGEIDFGPDGFLYIGLGDGGLADDPNRSALDLQSRLGKILRIDPQEADGEPFTVPADNPFVATEDADPTIWSYGLRNPWKFSFDSATGDLWIADVGQNEWEEVNRAPATDGRDAGQGLSFGWSAYEGDERFNDDQPADDHAEPFMTYARAEGLCSISGGAVYRGEAIPALDGWYVYGDYCTGQVFGFDTTLDSDDRVVVELAQTDALVGVAVGGDGELYVVSVGGTVARLS